MFIRVAFFRFLQFKAGRLTEGYALQETGKIRSLGCNTAKRRSQTDFYEYIRITPEEAAIKIKELWLARNDMKLIKDATEQLSMTV